MRKQEESLQLSLARYVRVQYPHTDFRSDFAAGIRMTMGQAVRHKNMQSGRAWPDFFVAEPYKFEPWESKDGAIWIHNPSQYHGLFIELKKEGTVLIRPKDASKVLKGEFNLRKKGEWFDEHISEQAATLKRLAMKGYLCKFAVGFEQAKRVVDEYLTGKLSNEVGDAEKLIL